jgi:ubiquitin C-terminal hydrolase
MSLVRYDPEYVPQVGGLKNGGALCYMNSMLQVLFSCSSFNQFMLENKENYEELAKTGNKLGVAYIELMEELGIQHQPEEFKIKVHNGSKVLRELIDARKRSELKGNLLHHRQEDCHEGLTFFIEMLGLGHEDRTSGVEDLFSIRYRMKIQCRPCKDVKDGPKAPPNFMFHLFEETPLLLGSLNSKEAIENYIRRHVNIPEDYKCEKCKIQNKVVNKKVTRNVFQVYSLARLSEIVILVFNKYESKKVKYFPTSLDFPSKDGTLHYEVVGQIEHYGTARGGHYVSKCRRPKPHGLDDFVKTSRRVPLENHLQSTEKQLQTLVRRQDLWSKKVDSEKQKVADGSTRNKAASDRTVRNLGIKLTALDKQITESKNSIEKAKTKLLDYDEKSNTSQPEDNEDVVFHINDSQVSFDRNGFQPTKNTYMVVYHLM